MTSRRPCWPPRPVGLEVLPWHTMSTINLPLYEYALAATQPDHGFGTVSRGSLETAREALADAIRTLREIERTLARWQ